MGQIHLTGHLQKILLVIVILNTQIIDSIAQSSLPQTDPVELAYDAAKKQFTEFEKNHGHYIKTKNVTMHYLTWGNPADPCLIWAHGSINNGYELLHIAEELVKQGFYVIAIDYYGHGLTPVPDHEVSLYHVADDIHFLMDELSIKKAFIGGFSRGAYIATAFYDTYPQRVYGLVLEDGGSVSANTYYHSLSNEQLEKTSKIFDDTTSNPWDTTYYSEFDAFKSMYDTVSKGTQFTLLALLKKNKPGEWSIIYSKMMTLFHLKNSRQFLDLTLRTTQVPLFAASMMMMEPSIIFRNLEVPVLILDAVSSNDPMPFEKENKALKEAHPEKITYIVYPDTDHTIHYDHPVKFVKDVTGFLKKSLP